jgi:flap endonuclease-1
MGVALKPLIVKRDIGLHDLKGTAIAIDAYNVLHQFLSIIRQRDGTLLKDGEGNVTSHLSGLLYRTANMVELGIRPVYVFDGAPHPLKHTTIEKRQLLKERARKEWERALSVGNMEEALKKAKRTSTLDTDKISGAKRLLDLLGIPYVDAPGEGEAQAAFMTARGDADAVASQDFDALLFGAPVLVRNIAVTGKRKLPDRHVWVDISTECIRLQEVLSEHGISREQLVDMAILMGTDFNDGIAGIWPKKALKLVRDYKDIERAVAAGEIALPENVAEIRRIFLNPAVAQTYSVRWHGADEDGVVAFLVEEHQFSEKRVRSSLEKYRQFAQYFNQSNLFDFQ